MDILRGHYIWSERPEPVSSPDDAAARSWYSWRICRISERHLKKHRESRNSRFPGWKRCGTGRKGKFVDQSRGALCSVHCEVRCSPSIATNECWFWSFVSQDQCPSHRR